MKMTTFIKQNRKEIDEVILSIIGKYNMHGVPRKLNDDTREKYIINVESLYLWAKRSGVRT